MKDIWDLFIAVMNFVGPFVIAIIAVLLLIDHLELRKTEFGWRAGWLGRVLGVHSPRAHQFGKCWCSTRRVSDA